MLAHAAPSSRSPSLIHVWLYRVLEVARHMGIIQSPQVPQPLTRRQQLLMAQSRRRAEERSRQR